MASGRFVTFSEAGVKSFSEKQENANTKNKTSHNLKLISEFLASEEEMQKTEEIPAAELQEFAIKFVLGVREKHGEQNTPVYIIKRKLHRGLQI